MDSLEGRPRRGVTLVDVALVASAAALGVADVLLLWPPAASAGLVAQAAWVGRLALAVALPGLVLAFALAMARIYRGWAGVATAFGFGLLVLATRPLLRGVDPLVALALDAALALLPLGGALGAAREYRRHARHARHADRPGS